ncbi:response regulator transcription factor [Acidovorax sp. Root219]|uniref:response regulator transcription factor n=1 Tax=Acidovorax sp. Root219 TaxID=1736493 RepID=UPI0009E9A9FD|nr:response regulator transcription factor [Acidovorax sp. Root219]
MTTLFQPLRVITRHSDPLMATGINAALMAAPGIEVVMVSDKSSFPDADVVIGDYESGMAWANHLRLRSSALRRRLPGVVVLTWRDSEADVQNALQAGVCGYLLNSCNPHELVDAVRAVRRGSPYLCDVAASLVATSLTRTPLTVRESEILQLIGSGMSNKVVASELNIALGTVKAHAKAILDKLGARSRTQATVIAAQRGLLGHHSSLRRAAMPHSPPISIELPMQQPPDRVAAWDLESPAAQGRSRVEPQVRHRQRSASHAAQAVQHL